MASTYVIQKWLPENEGDFNCEGVLDDYEGFRVLARGAGSMYRISFEGVVAYSSVEESSCFNDAKRAPGFGTKDCCFKVENSWYLSELYKISSGIRENDDINHYALYFSNQCIDVLSYSQPVVENLNQ